MAAIYDNRISKAIANTTFALDGEVLRFHDGSMESADQIRRALREKLDAKEITQADIARVLKVAQPNAHMLFHPAKNGKLRRIEYDEGIQLIEAFGLGGRGAQIAINEAVLSSVLADAMRRSPPDGWKEQDAPRLARAIVYGLELAASDPAIEANPGALAVASRAAVDRLLEESP